MNNCNFLDDRYSEGHTQGMKTAISIPDDLFHSADETAKNWGLSLSALIQRAIIDRLNKVYSKVDSSVPPDIQKYQRNSLPSEDW